jgi:hypothetical protein
VRTDVRLPRQPLSPNCLPHHHYATHLPPSPGTANANPTASLDHLVCPEEDDWGEGEAEGMGGLEVENQLEVHDSFHG